MTVTVTCHVSLLSPPVLCCISVVTAWHSWEWYGLAKMVHVVPHVGDPASDASRVLVSRVLR